MMLYAKRIRRAGFTLIEIMIVIVIIAILAGIMVPNFVRARAEAKYTMCLQNCETIGKALEMLMARHSILEVALMMDGLRGNPWYGPSKYWINDHSMSMQCSDLVGLGYLGHDVQCPIGPTEYDIIYQSGSVFASDDNKRWHDWCVLCEGGHVLGDEERLPQYLSGIGTCDYKDF